MIMPRSTESSDKTPEVSSTTEYAVFQRHTDNELLIDYTEQRLMWLINKILMMSKRKLQLIMLLSDYRKGKVAIAWRAGEPVFLRLETTLERVQGPPPEKRPTASKRKKKPPAPVDDPPAA
jgi:hypothetical protein